MPPPLRPPDVFEWDAIRPRALAPGEVLVQVRFIGVNYADIIARRGYYKWAGRPPICPGFEVSGEVIEVGPDVQIGIGTPVMAVTKFGGYTEALIVPQEARFPVTRGHDAPGSSRLPRRVHHCVPFARRDYARPHGVMTS